VRGGELGEGWGKWGQFTSNLRPRWTIPVTARRVPSKYVEGGTKGKWQGEIKGKGNAPCKMYIITRVWVYIGMIELMEDTSCI
jgi:hypothetical protein